ncbi:MAG: hypothetical protein IPM34_13075 [Saprospiraceae bacterium]|nr:hypothetical protein [Saprospiraceae bacterium]
MEYSSDIKINTSILLLVILISSWACDQKDYHSVEENPILSLLELEGTKIDTIEMATNVWEYGFRFTPLKPGVISKIGIKLPRVGHFRVKFYNLYSKSLITELDIESKSKHQEYYIPVNDQRIFPGRDYGISIVADAFYKVRNADFSAIIFPRIVGNIQIISFNEMPCGITGCPDFPDNSNSNNIAPCVTLGYIGDE